MKLLLTMFGSALLLAYSTGAVGDIGRLKAQDKKGQDGNPTKTSVPARQENLRVKLNVTVFDSSNRPATDVNSEDFEVFEDGVLQTITSVNRLGGPLRLALLIDCSGSLRSQLSTMMQAGKVIIANMKPEDEAFLVRFISSDNIAVVQDWTSNRVKLNGQIDEMYPEGGQSAIVDAVYMSAQHIAERRKLEATPHRHALVLITDGEERISYYKLEELLRLVRDSDLQIFVIGLVKEIDGKKAQDKAIDFLNTLANETGGRVFLIDGKLEVQQIAAEIALERDAQYLITYNSVNNARDGSYRKVRVAIKSKEGRDKRIALTRPGYTVPRK